MILDDEIKRLYRLLTLYFTDDIEFEKTNFETTKGTKMPFSLKKGILLVGTTGRAKTFCMERVFNAFISRYNKSKLYRIVNSYEIQIAFENEGTKAMSKFHSISFNSDAGRYNNLYIDEIGAESSEINHYGNKIKPIEMLLHERHRALIATGAVTHASTNLSIIDFKNHYSPRIFSRLFEMFNIITLTGNDLRVFYEKL